MIDDDNFEIENIPPSRNRKSRKSLNLVNILPILANNDDEEKNKKRKSIQKTELDETEINSEEISNHYNDCIIMANRGTINIKNAFKLKMIDYMKLITRHESIAQSTAALDAGIKIYAARVDSVQKNIHSVMGGMRDNNVEDVKDCSDDNEDDILNDAIKVNEVKTKSRSKRANKPIIAKDLSKYRLAESLVVEEVNILYRNECFSTNNPTVDRMQLVILDLIDDELITDYSRQFVFNENKLNRDFVQPDINYSISLDLESDLDFNIQVSRHFIDFLFMESNLDASSQSSRQSLIDAESYRDLLARESSMDPTPQPDISQLQAQIYEDMPHQDDNNELEDEEGAPGSLNSEDEVADPEDDFQCDLFIPSNDERISSQYIQCVNNYVESLAAAHSNMEELHRVSGALGLWAGPELWKQKSKLLNKKSSAPTLQHRTKTSKLGDIFPAYIATTISDNGGVRPACIPAHVKWDSSVNLDIRSKGGSRSTILSEAARRRTEKKSKEVIGVSLEKFAREFNTLMNREQCLVRREMKKDKLDRLIEEETAKRGLDDSLLNKSMDGTDAVDVMELDNEIDVMEERMEERDCDEEYLDLDNDMAASFMDGEDQADDLFDAVRYVDKVDVKYDRQAKKINVKRIKRQIYSCIPGEGEPSMSFQEVASFVIQSNGQQVTIPIVLNCLMHLANEIGLSVDLKTGDCSDLQVTRGMSELDRDLIKQYSQT